MLLMSKVALQQLKIIPHDVVELLDEDVEVPVPEEDEVSITKVAKKRGAAQAGLPENGSVKSGVYVEIEDAEPELTPPLPAVNETARDAGNVRQERSDRPKVLSLIHI